MSKAEAATSVKGALTGLAQNPAPGPAATDAAGSSAVQALPDAANAAQALSGTAAAQNAAANVAPGAADAASNAASGAVAGAADALARADGLFSWGGYFQALGLLFLIIALLWAALWFLKRKGGIKLLTMHGDLALESRMALGPKKSLVVVRFLNKRLLLGVTDHQITMLTELPRDEDDTEHTEPDPAPAAAFKAHLDRASGNSS